MKGKARLLRRDAAGPGQSTDARQWFGQRAGFGGIWTILAQASMAWTQYCERAVVGHSREQNGQHGA